MRIQTLGGLSADGAAGPLSGEAAQPRRLALLALLAWARDRGISRDKLVGLIWPDADGERARRILSQALYSLRKGLGAEDAVVGTQELRLNPDVISTDLDEFETARREGSLARAAELYRGPFLDGFHLPGAPEFERWADEARDSVAHDYGDLLERLATDAARGGDPLAAAGWWRRRAALDPLNARLATALMRAMADAGDRAGALRHARVYQVLVEQELDLPPDREVVALAEQLRSAPEPALASVAGSASSPGTPSPRSAVAAPPAPDAAPPAPAAVAAPESRTAAPIAVPASATASAPPPAPRRRHSRLWPLAIAALAGAVTLLAWPRGAAAPPLPADRQPLLMVGLIADYGGAARTSLGRPLADMVATDLARSPGLRVMSTARVYELLSQMHAGDSAASGFMSAARQAGATELLDGSLYPLGGGRLRLDLRRVDVGSGRVLGAYSVAGADPFQLADSLTGQLVHEYGSAAPGGLIADLTTRSLEAYRAYGAGLQAFFQGDQPTAERRFQDALAADSGFAMASYYYALASGDPATQLARMDAALRRAARASDRERLIISATWALMNHSPAGRAVAETLAVRYPAEVDGHLLLGFAQYADEDYLPGIRSYQRVLAMDSLALHGAQVRCSACDAVSQIVIGYAGLDSLSAALRAATDWTRVQHENPASWRALASMRELMGDSSGAEAAYRRAEVLDTSSARRHTDLERHLFALERYDEVERLDSDRLELLISRDERVDVLWDRMIAEQQEGRFQAALATATELRRSVVASGQSERDGNPLAITVAIAQAQTLRQNGRWPEAAALLDSLVAYDPAGAPRARSASTRGWVLAMLAGGLAGAGDTLRLGRIADSMEALARLTAGARERRLPHYVRGLLLAARGREVEAQGEFARGVEPVVDAFSPAVVQEARSLIRLGRAREAVRVLQPTLRGSYHFYMPHAELHAELAAAWAAAGNRDSALAQLAAADRPWRRADPSARARLRQLRATLRL